MSDGNTTATVSIALTVALAVLAGVIRIIITWRRRQERLRVAANELPLAAVREPSGTTVNVHTMAVGRMDHARAAVGAEAAGEPGLNRSVSVVETQTTTENRAAPVVRQSSMFRAVLSAWREAAHAASGDPLRVVQPPAASSA